VDEDDAKGVADLRAKGMTVIDNVDKAKFVQALAPVNAEFEKQFGKATLDKIRASDKYAAGAIGVASPRRRLEGPRKRAFR
jgi:TRAP-type C4-dicarboxylate transport system substrate-binding protein